MLNQEFSEADFLEDSAFTVAMLFRLERFVATYGGDCYVYTFEPPWRSWTVYVVAIQ